MIEKRLDEARAPHRQWWWFNIVRWKQNWQWYRVTGWQQNRQWRRCITAMELMNVSYAYESRRRFRKVCAQILKCQSKKKKLKCRLGFPQATNEAMTAGASTVPKGFLESRVVNSSSTSSGYWNFANFRKKTFPLILYFFAGYRRVGNFSEIS